MKWKDREVRIPRGLIVIGCVIVLYGMLKVMSMNDHNTSDGEAAEVSAAESHQEEWEEEPQIDVPDSSGEVTYTPPPFTNRYGSPATLCAHPGCSSTIARSGDTNCCAYHSNTCGECGCYIDEDAMWCLSCLENAVYSSAGGSSYSEQSGNTCLECGKPIDEDAMWCMECLMGAMDLG